MALPKSTGITLIAAGLSESGISSLLLRKMKRIFREDVPGERLVYREDETAFPAIIRRARSHLLLPELTVGKFFVYEIRLKK